MLLLVDSLLDSFTLDQADVLEYQGEHVLQVGQAGICKGQAHLRRASNEQTLAISLLQNMVLCRYQQATGVDVIMQEHV